MRTRVDFCGSEGECEHTGLVGRGVLTDAERTVEWVEASSHPSYWSNVDGPATSGALAYVEPIQAMYTSSGKPLIECAEPGCRMKFFYVPGRGERALLCLDHADERFGVVPWGDGR